MTLRTGVEALSIAFVCNSTNPDLVSYFLAKYELDGYDLGADLLWFSNAGIPRTRNSYISSYSKSSSFSVRFLLDVLISVFVVWVLLKRKAKLVIFDTAHISNLPIAFFCKVFGVRTVFTVHDWMPHPGRKKFAVRLYNAICKRFLADRFIVFSRIDYQEKPIIVLRLAGFPHYRLEVKAKQYFLFFGRIEPYKGLANMLRIAMQLKEVRPGARIIIAGSGKDPSLAELSTLSNVEVINRFIGASEVPELFAGAIATLLPYDSATQSGVSILSYSYDTPVIAYDVGSLKEYIEPGRTGEVVAHGNVEEFVRKMREVEDNLERYKRHIGETFEQMYGPSALLNQYAAVLSSLSGELSELQSKVPQAIDQASTVGSNDLLPIDKG